MKLNDVQKRLLSQKQVTKPHMMRRGGNLPKAQESINLDKGRPTMYEGMDSTALANVFNKLYGDYKFHNTGLDPNDGSVNDQIMQMFIESQGSMNPTRKFPMYFSPRGGYSFKKGGTTKGSNGVL